MQGSLVSGWNGRDWFPEWVRLMNPSSYKSLGRRRRDDVQRIDWRGEIYIGSVLLE